MTRLADLAPALLDSLRTLRYDYAVEKHEGPNDWEWYLPDDDAPQVSKDPAEYASRYAEILTIHGYDVLLPLPASTHGSLHPERVIPSADGNSLTIILYDTALFPDYYPSLMFTGRLAFCDRLADSSLFVTISYHAMFCDATVLWRDRTPPTALDDSRPSG